MNAPLPPESQFTNYVDYVDAIRRVGYSESWNQARLGDSRPIDVPSGTSDSAAQTRSEPIRPPA